MIYKTSKVCYANSKKGGDAMQNTMTHHGYIGSLELDGQKGVLFGRVLGIREKIAYTAQDAAGIATAFRKAVDQYIHACERAGKKPEESICIDASPSMPYTTRRI